jgi:hypothetical protein
MSLPACQQRILDGIAGTLQARDPRLVSMFAIFTRLTRSEPMPSNEALDAGRVRRAVRRMRRLAAPRPNLRALVIIPVVLAAVVSLVILAPVAGGVRPCGHGLAGRTYVQLAGRFGACRTGLGVATRQR